jgi:hypothetical protein
MAKVEGSEHLSSETPRTRWIFHETADPQIKRLRDTEGRPLGEQRVAGLFDSVETELVRCPYRGSRYHHAKPMNVSALRQAVASWAVILGGLAQVHRGYRERVDADPLTLFDLWRLINLGICLPSFAALRAVDPLRDTEVPVWLAGIYKVLIGVHVPVAQLMLEELLRGGIPAPLPSAEELLEHVESNRSLVGVKEVCAGPPSLILQTIRVTLSGDSGDAEIDPTLFNGTLGDDGAVVFYALRTVDLLILNFNFAARMRCDASRLARLVQQAAEDRGPTPLGDALLSRLELLAKEQSGHTIDFCRRIERIVAKVPGIDMRTVASVLETKISQPIQAEPTQSARSRRLPARGTQDSLVRLVREEWGGYQAREQTFLANATALSHSILATLGYPADAAEIQREDLVSVTGKNLGDLFREIGEEFSLGPAPRAKTKPARNSGPAVDEARGPRAIR